MVPLVDVFGGLVKRLVRASFGSKTVAKSGEGGLPYFAEYPVDGLLNKPILYRRNTQLSGAAVTLGDFNPTNGLGVVITPQQLALDSLPVVCQETWKVFCFHAVHACRSTVTHHCGGSH